MITIYELEILYQQFNKEYFGGHLPFTIIEFTNVAGCYGRCIRKRVFNGYSHKIQISSRYKMDDIQLETTLLHEMIHLYLWLKEPDVNHKHDFYFMYEASRINSESKWKYNIQKMSDGKGEISEYYMDKKKSVANKKGYILFAYPKGENKTVLGCAATEKALSIIKGKLNCLGIECRVYRSNNVKCEMLTKSRGVVRGILIDRNELNEYL
jgi:hypothetical protein